MKSFSCFVKLSQRPTKFNNLEAVEVQHHQLESRAVNISITSNLEITSNTSDNTNQNKSLKNFITSKPSISDQDVGKVYKNSFGLKRKANEPHDDEISISAKKLRICNDGTFIRDANSIINRRMI